jgi:hypothetical protein
MEDIQTLHTVTLESGDPRNPVSVSVERRETDCRDGRRKSYINLLICVGNRRLIIPRRIARALAETLPKMVALADKEYEALLVEINRKVTVKEFAANLAAYDNGGAARRAVGKFRGWTDEERERAKKLVDAKFGPSETRRGKITRALASKSPKKAKERAPTKTTMKSIIEESADDVHMRIIPPTDLDRRLSAEAVIDSCAVAADNLLKIASMVKAADVDAAARAIIDTQNKAVMSLASDFNVATVPPPVASTIAQEEALPKKSNGRADSRVPALNATSSVL